MGVVGLRLELRIRVRVGVLLRVRVGGKVGIGPNTIDYSNIRQPRCT